MNDSRINRNMKIARDDSAAKLGHKYLRGKKDATTFSRQACFVNRFTIGALLSVINRARELIFF